MKEVAAFFNNITMANNIEQPDMEYQRLLNSVMEEEPETVVFNGKVHRIGWLHNKTIRKFSHIMVKEKSPMKRNVKLASVILCNGNYFTINFLYPLYWRWLYYFKDISVVDALRIVDAGKKKLPQKAFLLITILSTGMTDLMMTMIAGEAKPTQAGQAGEQPTP